MNVSTLRAGLRGRYFGRSLSARPKDRPLDGEAPMREFVRSWTLERIALESRPAEEGKNIFVSPG